VNRQAIEQRINLINIEMQKMQGHLQEANHWLMELIKKEQEEAKALEAKRLEEEAAKEKANGEANQQAEEQAA
jgi:uncharacterized protein YaaN involved in tellurite resistance